MVKSMYFDYLATTIRHNRITGTFFKDILELLKLNRNVHALQEQLALVHKGTKKKNEQGVLIDINQIDDIDLFVEIHINDYEYIQPDFACFVNNPYIINKRKTRTAGQPDLIVEVWSSSNDKAEKQWKFDMYSNSEITEHWYINEDSNIIECFYGFQKLPAQNLKNILKTQNGLTFDLRYLYE